MHAWMCVCLCVCETIVLSCQFFSSLLKLLSHLSLSLSSVRDSLFASLAGECKASQSEFSVLFRSSKLGDCVHKIPMNNIANLMDLNFRPTLTHSHNHILIHDWMTMVSMETFSFVSFSLFFFPTFESFGFGLVWFHALMFYLSSFESFIASHTCIHIISHFYSNVNAYFVCSPLNCFVCLVFASRLLISCCCWFCVIFFSRPVSYMALHINVGVFIISLFDNLYTAVECTFSHSQWIDMVCVE